MDRPGRPIEVIDSLLEELFEQDRRQSTNVFDQNPKFWSKTLFSCNGKQKVILLPDKIRPHVAKSFTTPGIISWLSSIWLPLVPIDAAFLPGENLYRSRKNQKRPRLVFFLQTRKLLQDWNTTTTRKMGESHTKWWKLFW
jgi:hypothetical protein